MKRNFIIIMSLLLVIGIFAILVDIRKKDDEVNNDLKVVQVAEVTHSVFYAPLYVALENGYFEDNGLSVELILTSGADKVSAAVLSNSVQIGFSGPEAAIYVYENGEKDYLVTFAGLTKRDGQFIVARKKIDNFKVEDMYGKEVLAGRVGGMPLLNFINGLKNSDGDIKKINVNTSIDFASLSGVFISGVGDFVNLFDDSDIRGINYSYITIII